VSTDSDSDDDNDDESDGGRYKELDVRFETLTQTISNLEKLYLLIQEEPLACPWRSYSHYLDCWYESKASKDCYNAGCELVEDDALFLRLKRASIERTKRVAVWLKSTHMTAGVTPLERLGQARLQELRPYLCTYDDCITENEQYASRSEWLAHEQHVHSTPVWTCRDHLEVAVSSENEFKRHLIIDHPDLKPVHIDMLSLHSKRGSPDSRNYCPLCLLDVEDLQDRTMLTDHIAEHLETIASSSLPLKSIAEQRSTSHLAMKIRSAPMTRILLHFGAHTYLLERPCLRTLQAASSAGHVEFVQALCDAGADVLILNRMVAILRRAQSKKRLLAGWLGREETERSRKKEAQMKARTKQHTGMNEEEQKREPRELKMEEPLEEQSGDDLWEAAEEQMKEEAEGHTAEDARTKQMMEQISARLRTQQAEEAEREARVRAGQATSRQRLADIEQRLAAERRLEQEQHERDVREQKEGERLRQEWERREKERLQSERLERERVQREGEERKRQERARLGKERLEKERLERERLEKERLEKERLEKERLEKEHLDRVRLEKVRLERERLEREHLERERSERERFDKERQERVRQTREREVREREEQQNREQEQRRQRQDARRLVQARTQDASRNIVPTHLRTGSGAIAAAAPQPPWQFSQTLGGEFVYRPSTDTIFLRHGRAFVRPPQITRDALANAAWDGPLPSAPHVGSTPTQPVEAAGTVSPYRRQGVTNVGRPEASHAMYQATAMAPQSGIQQRGENPAAMASSIPAGVQSGSQTNRHPTQTISAQGEVLIVFQNPAQGQTSRGEVVPPNPRERGINIGGAERLASALFPNFIMRPQSIEFFAVGRVFRVLCSEPATGASVVTSWEPGVVLNSIGQRAFAKVRRFVVIRTSSSYCTALPINSYGGQGVARPGVNKSQHVIVFSRGSVPPSAAINERPGRGERGMHPVPVRVDADSQVEHLDVMSRINLAGATTVGYDIKVRSVGVVNARSMRSLLDQFAVVWGSQPLPVPSSVVLPGATSGFAGGVQRDSDEDTDDQEEDDEDYEDDDDPAGDDEDDEDDDEDNEDDEESSPRWT
jgi:hypothetical protein